MLEIKNLHAKFQDQPILKGVDLVVKPGEIHVILGPNGSGKSTLGRVLLGDSQYDVVEGDIVFKTESFRQKTPSERAKSGFFLSFQSPPEIDGVSARNLLFAAKKSLDPTFTSSFKFKRSFEKNLESMRLSTSFADREMNKGFSGGERKKMEMASLLSLDPSLVFLDEIDSGVDVDTISAIGKGFNTWFDRGDKSAIIVSHSEKLLDKINPTQVHILCHGKIIRSGGQEIIDKVHREGFDAFVSTKKIKGFQVV